MFSHGVCHNYVYALYPIPTFTYQFVTVIHLKPTLLSTSRGRSGYCELWKRSRKKKKTFTEYSSFSPVRQLFIICVLISDYELLLLLMPFSSSSCCTLSHRSWHKKTCYIPGKGSNNIWELGWFRKKVVNLYTWNLNLIENFLGCGKSSFSFYVKTENS